MLGWRASAVEFPVFGKGLFRRHKKNVSGLSEARLFHSCFNQRHSSGGKWMLAREVDTWLKEEVSQYIHTQQQLKMPPEKHALKVTFDIQAEISSIR